MEEDQYHNLDKNRNITNMFLKRCKKWFSKHSLNLSTAVSFCPSIIKLYFSLHICMVNQYRPVIGMQTKLDGSEV